MIALLFPLSLFGQQRDASFDVASGFMSDAYDVAWTLPQNMIDLNTSVDMTLKRGYRTVSSCGPVVESKNQDCILMYSQNVLFVTDLQAEVSDVVRRVNRKLHGETTTSTPITTDNWHRGIMKGELMTAYGYYANNNLYKLPHLMYKAAELKRVAYGSGGTGASFKQLPEREFRLEEYVSIISGKKAQRWFNADSVFVYTLPVDDPYKEGYIYCTGVMITKKERAGIGLKLYFTEEGKKKESEYLRLLRGKIRYRNDAWKYDKEVVKRAAQTYYGNETSAE